MAYSVKTVTQTKAEDTIYFEIVLENPVNGVASLSIPAKSEKEALSLLEKQLGSK